MDSLNEYVLGFVKEKVSKSHILKDKFKKEILHDKFQRIKDIKNTEKDLETRLQRIQKEMDNIENNIVEMKISKGLGVKDESIVIKIFRDMEKNLKVEKFFMKILKNRLMIWDRIKTG